MKTISDELLIELAEYIESMEERCDGEWGSNRSIEKLVADGSMPPIYFKLKLLLES